MAIRGESARSGPGGARVQQGEGVRRRRARSADRAAAGTSSASEGDGSALPPASLPRRLAWVLGLAVWVFLALSLVTFDSADSPSHAVAVHNIPPANVCGAAGAAVAYWGYHVLGLGSWIILLGLALALGVTVTGRIITHPLMRAVGLLILALSLASVHGLIAPNSGPLAGSEPGLVAQQIVVQMLPRFSVFGSLLILLCALGLGAIVAAEQIVFSIPRWTMVAIGLGSEMKKRLPASGLGRLGFNRPRPAMEGLGMGGVSVGGVVGVDAVRERVRKGRKIKGGGGVVIDPDAGGLGAVDAFDPEKHEIDLENDDTHAPDEDTGRAGIAKENATAAARKSLTPDELRAKIAKLPLRMASSQKTIARDEDIPRAPPPEENYETYQFPTLELLGDPESNYSGKMEAFVREQAQTLEQALQTYGIDGEVVGIESGPVVTLYSVQLAPGTKVAKITAVSSDIARTLGAQNIRIVANIAGKTTIGIEVPNIQKERVRLKELMSNDMSKGMQLPMFLGKDASGEPLIADLTRMPHMLIAGYTGSGKSVCINAILMSWLYTKRPDELKLVLVDPKMVELSQFADIPHLMCPVVTDTGKAAAILEWAVNKMEERYELLKEAMVRDIGSYNALTDEEKFEIFKPSDDVERAKIPKRLPYMVFIIDELADLILTHKDVEHSIVRIAQKARAVGIHLILATQRPQANVVTGLIKSNMPCRVAFKVASGMDSRIVLDQKGAELLLGQGDMLFLTPHSAEIRRAQGTLVTDGETRKVVTFLKGVAAPTFERSLLAVRSHLMDGEEGDGAGGDGEGGMNPAERDPMFDEAVKIMIESGRGSVSLLQRRLAIGYTRASRLVDQMGQAGILGEHKGSVAREVMITLEDWEQMKRLEEEAAAHGGVDSQDDDAMGESSFDNDGSPEIETVDRDGVPAEFEGEYRN
jgi:S-DNA-T family DNA segregation ATPase FtsK/SpoIIIE